VSIDRDDRWGDDDRGDRFGDTGPGDRDRRRALGKVKAPAILLIVTAVLSLLATAWNAYSYASGDLDRQLDAQLEVQRKQVDENPQINAQDKQRVKDTLTQYFQAIRSALPIVLALVALARIVMLVAGVRLLSGSGRGLGILASILAMIPCVDGCCLLGLPVGIWSLVVLLSPDVKAAFRAPPAATEEL
jgi:hypothetical protein